MNITIVGHTGFLGKSFLKHLNDKNSNYEILGISNDTLDTSDFDYLSIRQSTDLNEKINKSQNFVFFLSHGQKSIDPCQSEKLLAENFISFIKENKIDCPIILIKSIGNDSDHIRSRTLFNEKIKSSLNNKIFEIKATIIASPGSISYDIPYKVVEKMSILPEFPWFKNKVSLVDLDSIFKIFDNIIAGSINSLLIEPEFETLTYKEYIQKISRKIGKEISFFRFPLNLFIITSFLVSIITGYDYRIVKNLMYTLKKDAVM